MLLSCSLKGTKDHRVLESKEENHLSRNHWGKRCSSLRINLSWGHWGGRRVSDLFKVNMLEIGIAGILNQACGRGICHTALCDQRGTECPTPGDGLLSVQALQDALFILYWLHKSLSFLGKFNIHKHVFASLWPLVSLNSCKRYNLCVFKYIEHLTLIFNYIVANDL